MLEERSSDRGILGVPAGGFPAVFDATFGDWMAAPGARCLIAGMAGSRQGWAEVPYAGCPAGASDLAAGLRWIIDRRIAIVPGVAVDDAGSDVPDVMRGEETQVLGALALLGIDAGLFVLPGTHSKWVRVTGGRIEGFATSMTGEFYALLRRHSILAKSLPADDAAEAFDAAAFDEGVAHAMRGTSLLRTAFGVRTLSLFERKASEALASYLSGLVIGDEVRAEPNAQAADVVAIGAEALTSRYARALAARGCMVRCLGSEATWRGLHALAAAAWS